MKHFASTKMLAEN